MPKPFDANSQTNIQRDIERRRRAYREAIVRRLVVRHAVAGRDDWKKQAGWSAADEAKYTAPKLLIELIPAEIRKDPRYLSGLSYSTCDVLRYRPPTVVAEDDYDRSPIIPADQDDSIIHALARLGIAADNPVRQQELFGWVSPQGGDAAKRVAFEAIKAPYWEKVCASSFSHVELLKDTADFKANELLRLLYLAGDLPPHLRAQGTPGRAPGSANRDENFSKTVEDHIVKALLAFKYWLDDPFFPGPQTIQPDWFGIKVGPVPELTYPGDHEAITAARQQSKEWEDRKQPGRDMTYWSENHQILFAAAEYLAGQWLPDEVFRAGLPYRRDAAQSSRPGDLTGRQRMNHAKPRLLRWLDDRLRFGLSEWMSPGYYAEDIQPLLNLVDFCIDDEIRSRALIVLDRTIFDLARFTLGGNFGATAGRCYFEKKACGHDQSVADLVHVMFDTRGGVIVWDGDETAGFFVSSKGYLVPDVLVAIAQDQPQRLIDRSRVSINFDESDIYGIGFKTVDDAMVWWGRGAFFADRVLDCTIDTVQRYNLRDTPPFSSLSKLLGALAMSRTLPTSLFLSRLETSAMAEGSSLTRANLYTYKNRNTMLSSVQNFRAAQMGSQLHACQATLGVAAMVWTTHLSAGGYVQPRGGVSVATLLFGGPVLYGVIGGVGGMDPEEAFPADWKDGPNWWTGSATMPRVVQHEGAAIIAYNPGSLDDIFGSKTHAWFPKPAFDSVRQRAAGDCNIDDGNWTFGRVGDGYVGLFSARTVEWAVDGPWVDKDLLAESGRNIFILQVGDTAEFGSFDNFVAKVSGARVHINGLRWGGANFECSYDIASPAGGRLELHWDEDKVRYNGAAFSDDNFPRFETPYVRCGKVRWDQYRYTIELGNNSLTHDFSQLKTQLTGAQVLRVLGGDGYDCAADALWVISHRGASRLFPENTIEACMHAVQIEAANALALDACFTADGQVVLWNDWDPDSWSALARQLGVANVGAYRPTVPDLIDPLRRPVIELSLAELHAGYGYALVGQPQDVASKSLPISTLADLVSHRGDMPGLRHLLLMIRMPAEAAEKHASRMLRTIVAAFEASVAFETPVMFDLTLLVTEQEVLASMQTAADDLLPVIPIAFSLHRDIAPRTTSATEGTYRPPWEIKAASAVEAAIAHRCAIASIGPAPASPILGLFYAGSAIEYDEVVWYDAGRLETFNLNPRENGGHQVERLIVTADDHLLGIEHLMGNGVSGIITDNVPMLRQMMAKNGIS